MHTELYLEMPKVRKPLLIPKHSQKNIKMCAFKVLLMMNTQTAVLQDVETYCITINTCNLKIESAGSFEMLGTTLCQVNFWQS
jgi:hypothetical protein